MDREVLREGEAQVEVWQEVTGTGPRLRVRSVGEGTFVDLDPLELEGLTRLPFTSFPPLEGALDQPDVTDEAPATGADGGLAVLRNEFAMVGIWVGSGPSGRRLWVRNMASGAEVTLHAGQLDRLTRLRHRDLAPLVDPSGLAAEVEPDPDQV